MSSFLRKGFREQQRLSELKQAFVRSCDHINGIADALDLNSDDLLLLLAPVVEVAWADGRITARETEAILEIAERYGIAEDEGIYCDLMESLLTRPSATEWARNWFKTNRALTLVDDRGVEIIADALLTQARYVAEHSSNSLIGFLRGDGIGRDEESLLRRIGDELERLKAERVPDLTEEFEPTPDVSPMSMTWRGMPVYSTGIDVTI